jgi:hypothetical protein
MGLENQINKFYVIVVNNFNYLYSLLNLDSEKKPSNSKTTFASDEENLINKLIYYTLSIIDCRRFV